jgi:hypothetical protein
MVNRAASEPSVETPAPTLADRFWQIHGPPSPTVGGDSDPVAILRHALLVLRELAAVDRDAPATEHTVATLSLLTLLRQQENQGDLTYASPEQIRGEPLSESALVFSVGVILFQRLCGHHPFGKNLEARRARMREGRLGSGVNYFPMLPEPLRSILARALDPDPDSRYQTLGGFGDSLRMLLDTAAPRLPGTGDSGREPWGALSGRLTAKGSAPRVRSAWTPKRATKEEREDDEAPDSDDEVAAPGSDEDVVEIELTAEEPSPLEAGSERRRWPLILGLAAVVVSAIAGFVAVAAMVEQGDPPTSPDAVGGGETDSPAAQAAPAFEDVERIEPALEEEDAPALEARVGKVAASAPAAVDAPTAGDHDANRARAIELVTGCFPRAQIEQWGVAFTLSVVYDVGRSSVSRVYFPSVQEMTPDQQRCVHDRMLELRVSAPVARAAVVRYRFQLTAAGGSAIVQIVE